MTGCRYAIAAYSERLPALEALTALTQRAFAEYPGVIAADRDFTEWFMSRPGFDAAASWAAWCGAAPVGSVFLTRVPLSLAGRWVDVGVVDTVMVDPEHRGQGLARALMERTIASCQGSGLKLMQLYTAPGSVGYRLYAGLGFKEQHRLRYWHCGAGALNSQSVEWQAASSDGLAGAGKRLQSLAADYDGVPMQSEAVRRWRWMERPAAMPATIWVSRHDVIAASTPVNLTDGRCVVLLKDLVGCDGASVASLCAQLGVHEYVTIADVRDGPLEQALADAGFTPGQDEAAMMLSLAPEIALGSSTRPWFPLTESVIGA